MSRRWLVWAVVAAVVIAGALIAIGRWERDHQATDEMRGMRKVLAAIGPLDNPTLSMYRVNVGFGFDCLLYKRGANKFALEVCFDKSGRVIETLDRRGAGDPKISSLREDPGASTLRIDRATADRLLHELDAPGH
jgi:hypothetical protein